MGANTKIEWCDHTFSPWRGCTKVAAGCANCYAEAQAKRNTGTLGIWGPNGTRVVAAESAWKQVEKWDRIWREMPERIVKPGSVPVEYMPLPKPAIFCGSMCDVFEDWPGRPVFSPQKDVDGTSFNPVTYYGPVKTRSGIVDQVCHAGQMLGNGIGSHWQAWEDRYRPATLSDVRQRLFRLIDETVLTWLLLTKRPENIRRFWPSYGFPNAGVSGTLGRHVRRDNVYLGTSIACQEDADKNIPELLKCRDLCAGIFLSIEPLVGPVDFGDGDWFCPKCDAYLSASRVTNDERCDTCGTDVEWHNMLHSIDQVIIGGESGPNARPCDVELVRSIARQCEAAGVPCFVKQLGSHCIVTNEYHPHPSHWSGMSADPRGRDDGMTRVLLRDKKGGDPAEWPEDLRVRQLAWKGGA